MYVIFPAEDVVDLTLGIVSPNNPAYPCLVPSVPSSNQRSAEQQDGPYQQYLHANTGSGGHWFHNKDDPSQDQVKQELPSSGKKEKKKKQQRTTTTKSRTQQGGKMATGGDVTLRELAHPALNEALKGHNSVTFKLVRTVSDFAQQLAQIYEQHAEEMQLLVSNFRKKNADLRKERPACPSSLFHTWETMLQEVEIDSQAHSDIASVLGRQVARPLVEKSFHRKIQSRKVFTHRESYETILVKTEEKLAKCRQDYKNSYLVYLSSPTTASLANYFDTHNAYVQQLHATNGMLEQYNTETLPQLLQELEEVYSDLCSTLTESVLQGAEVISNRASEQYRRYEGLSSQCKAVLPSTDLAHFVRSVTVPQHHPHRPSLRHNFLVPQPPPPPEVPDGPGGGAPHDNTPNLQDLNPPPPLKNELVVDRLVNLQPRSRFEALKKEALELDTQIKQLQDSLDTLLRIQQRSLESNLYNKVNELQEDISMKRFDLRVAQIHLSAVKSQKELFASKVESTSESGRERKMSSSSTGSMKNKWLKAFKSLKTGSGTNPTNGAPREADKKNGKETTTLQAANADPSVHAFQEYTYKKITPCDVCSQVLRGHARQGLKCRVCKMNVHVDCQGQVGRCQPKSRLLRRQKSTSEIETRIPDALPDEEKSQEVDIIYQVLKQAGEISSNRSSSGRGQDAATTTNMTKSSSAVAVRDPSGSGGSSGASSVGSLHRRQPPLMLRGASSSLTVAPVLHASTSAPHSPRRQKLNLRMKSLSLDSPESTEHVQRRRHAAQSAVDAHSSQSSSSRIQSPSSPVHNRRLLSARTMRMSSVELPDDNEKSLSSASTSPCPSPKPYRLLPTNLYVVLYNFKSRHPDELDLKAGYKVTVIDTTDPDWWKGKCLGRVGYFPSKYVIKLQPGERPLQVTHNLQVSDGDNGLMLLRDQIVIQVGEDLDGMVMIRSGDSRQGVCPLKFLQEV